MIRHVSCDFWGTLASPNPEFSKARNKHLAEFFGVDEAEMKAAYTKVKTHLDNQAESTGVQGDVIEAYFTLFRTVGFKGLREHAEALNQEISDLFIKYPPIFPKEIERALFGIRNSGVSLSITSNTNFISGAVIEKVLKGNIGEFFEFYLFSDLLGVAKPNLEMFKLVRSMASRAFAPNEVLHIGDNLNADVLGANNAGFESVLVGSPDDTMYYLIH